MSTSSKKNRPLRRARIRRLREVRGHAAGEQDDGVDERQRDLHPRAAAEHRVVDAQVDHGGDERGEEHRLRADEGQRADADEREAMGDVRRRRVGAISVQRPFIHTASVMRMSATPTMNTSGTPSMPMPRMRMPNATQNGVIVRCSGSAGSVGPLDLLDASALVLVPVLGVPERPVAADLRQPREVVVRRRRGGGPLQRPGAPRVVARLLAGAQAADDVVEEQQEPDGEDEAADGRDQVQRRSSRGPARRCTRAAACPGSRARTSGRRSGRSRWR